MPNWYRCPPLKGGSPAQRKWACAIRRKVIRRLEATWFGVQQDFEDGEDADWVLADKCVDLRDALYQRREFGWWLKYRDGLHTIQAIEKALSE